jgi:hypothetical protein
MSHGKDPCFSLLFYNKDLVELVNVGIKVVEKRYGSRIVNDPVIQQTWKNLAKYDDPYPRLLLVLCFLVWEPNINAEMERAYASDQFGGTLQFRKFVGRVSQFVDAFVRFPSDHNNAKQMIEDFVESAKREYAMGPFA